MDGHIRVVVLPEHRRRLLLHLLAAGGVLDRLIVLVFLLRALGHRVFQHANHFPMWRAVLLLSQSLNPIDEHSRGVVAGLCQACARFAFLTPAACCVSHTLKECVGYHTLTSNLVCGILCYKTNYSPDDPHYGLGPVHTSLYVRVA